MTADVIPGLQRAVKLLDAYYRFDMANAENESLSEEDRDRAFNCAARIGQAISALKCHIAQVERARVAELEKQNA